jgi:hypothetical protein
MDLFKLFVFSPQSRGRGWLNTRRLKGMSRDWLSVIFCFDLDISVSPRRPAEILSLPPDPSRTERRPLAPEGGADH